MEAAVQAAGVRIAGIPEVREGGGASFSEQYELTAPPPPKWKTPVPESRMMAEREGIFSAILGNLHNL